MQMVSSDRIAIQFLDDVAEENVGNYLRLLRVWAGDALRDIGMPVEIYLKYQKRIIDQHTQSFAAPEDLNYTVHIMLECGCVMYEPVRYRDGSRIMWGTGANHTNSMDFRPDSQLSVGLDREANRYFIATPGGRRYDHAHIEYVGDPAKDGEFGIPSVATNAVKSFLEYKWTQRSRALNRTAIPMDEVRTAKGAYDVAKIQAYARMKATDMGHLKKVSMERHYRPLRNEGKRYVQ